MDWFIQSFEEEDRKLDERLKKINSDTLNACEKILRNPERYKKRAIVIAKEIKEELSQK